MPDDDRVSPTVPALFVLSILANTTAGDVYTASEHRSMLKGEGAAVVTYCSHCHSREEGLTRAGNHGSLPMEGESLNFLIGDLVEWIAARERTYEEVMEAWRTSCPKLPVWEERRVTGGGSTPRWPE